MKSLKTLLQHPISPLKDMHSTEEAHHDDDVHLHEEKGLISYLSLQISKFNDETLKDLKRIDVVEKPLESEEFMGIIIPSCDEWNENYEYEDMINLLSI